MSQYSNIKVNSDNGILEVILDRPKANAIDAVTSHALGEIFVSFRDDPTLRVAIITGAGERFFSAGWDLKAAAEGEAPDADFGPGGFAGLTELFDLNKPVIAAINGFAAGGGFELALACDLIVAADHAQFFLSEAQLGIIPDSGGVFRLPRRLPAAIATEMLLLGRRMDASEAARWGLVNQVCSSAQLMNQARELAHKLLQSAPLSIAAIKEICRETEQLSIEESYQLQRSGKLEIYQKMLRSQDAVEGPLAFSEKRAPRWQGK